ncbi:NAD(P)/FAD-dependent oxidoreductase [Sinorhizobium fredii]|uniref:NAD(P)/FAD-dependent oxidoreductase n=1 Tax=Rhizobium fredii TaxID=380 RepID=UPI00059565A5|nr:FAD-dependent oxidoreductase [Sinorhizobium fredii]WOS66179.1 FAD-dependent oxidoreductase [Sinorhizobium fredii GR64]
MDYDVIVIGGGLVGVSIAWGLSRCGQRVAIVDEDDVANRAARANFGLVWSSSKGLGNAAYSRWSRTSTANWHRLAAELKAETGIDTGFVQSGGFSIRLTPTELERGIASMARLADQQGMDAEGTPPLEYEILDQAETRRRLPLVGETVAGAIFSPLDGHANPLRLFAGFHKALQQRGVHYFPHRKTTAIRHSGGAFELAGEGWRLGAGKIVLAAGIGNTALAPMVGLSVPLSPSRGQIIVTERLKPFLSHATGYLRQTDEGSVLIGESKEATIDHQRPRGPITSVLAERALRTFPLLRDAKAVRIWAAFRVVTPDGYPIYEQSERFPGAFAFACHSGVTLAANHALVLPRQISAGALSEDLSVFHSRRFHVPAAV